MSRTLTTAIDEFNELLPNCPTCQTNKDVVRSGSRKVKNGYTKRYRCTRCMDRFTNRTIPSTTYPPKTILTAISLYNKGHPQKQVISLMRRRHKTTIPRSTLKTWIDRYQEDFPFTKMRKQYDLNPQRILRKRNLDHSQPFIFLTHELKLNIKGKQFPSLRTFIIETLNERKDYLFQDNRSVRCSQLAQTIDLPKPPTRTINTNAATKMTHFAEELARTKIERHQKVEEFFLINDTATIATEVPVYLYKNEAEDLNLQNHLVGHMDIVQVRNNRIHILDYKPENNQSERTITNQLTLYAIALQKRTKIKPEFFTCAYFNDSGYTEFEPFGH